MNDNSLNGTFYYKRIVLEAQQRRAGLSNKKKLRKVGRHLRSFSEEHFGQLRHLFFMEHFAELGAGKPFNLL